MYCISKVVTGTLAQRTPAVAVLFASGGPSVGQRNREREQPSPNTRGTLTFKEPKGKDPHPTSSNKSGVGDTLHLPGALVHHLGRGGAHEVLADLVANEDNHLTFCRAPSRVGSAGKPQEKVGRGTPRGGQGQTQSVNK